MTDTDVLPTASGAQPELCIVGRPVRPHGGDLTLGDPLRLLVREGRVAQVEPVRDGADARGRVVGHPDAVLVPGLHDGHIHLFACAAREGSARLDEPSVVDIPELQARVRSACGAGEGWVRATGFDETRLAERRMPTLAELDEIDAERPIRIRHVTRHASLLNRAGWRKLGMAEPQSAVLYEREAALTRELGPLPRSRMAAGLAGVVRDLAARGVVAVEDLTAANDPERIRDLAEMLPGGVRVAAFLGDADDLDEARREAAGRIAIIGLKLLPRTAEELGTDRIRRKIASARRRGLPVAVHAVEPDEVDAALRAMAPARGPGDRIEHASLCPPGLMGHLRTSGVTVVTQPGFVSERGDKYRAEVEPALWPYLYPLRAFRDAGVPVRGSSDGPVATFDPWVGIRAAIERRTRSGDELGGEQALAEADGLSLYVPGGLARAPWNAIGTRADVAVFETPPWKSATPCALVTVSAGRCIWEKPR